MSTVPFATAPETDPKQNRTDIADTVEQCLERTAQAIYESEAAGTDTITTALANARGKIDDGHPADLLEEVARSLGHDEERIGRAILELGDKVASTLYPSPPLIPFASKLIAPSAFYDSFDHLHKLARALLSPVIFAEDSDAVGTASINPVAALIFSEEVAATVARRFGIRPFVTVARLDYEGWAFLTRKHFEL